MNKLIRAAAHYPGEEECFPLAPGCTAASPNLGWLWGKRVGLPILGLDCARNIPGIGYSSTASPPPQILPNSYLFIANSLSPQIEEITRASLTENDLWWLGLILKIIQAQPLPYTSAAKVKWFLAVHSRGLSHSEDFQACLWKRRYTTPMIRRQLRAHPQPWRVLLFRSNNRAAIIQRPNQRLPLWMGALGSRGALNCLISLHLSAHEHLSHGRSLFLRVQS